MAEMLQPQGVSQFMYKSEMIQTGDVLRPIGLAVAIRAGVTAYVLASILALVWVGLMQLRPGRHTLPLFGLFTAAALSLAAWQLGQERHAFALIGTAEGTIGITAGASCPNNLIEDVIRRLFALRGISLPPDAGA